jgi:beta-fructofuranosidase
VFLRDNVPVMLYLLLEGRFDIVRHFLSVCLDLQSNTYQTRGLFPTSFVEENGQLLADYGQRSIGRITSVDASLLFVPDCSFMIDRLMDVWGAPLEVEVLLFGCLRSCGHLMEIARRDRSSSLLEQRLKLTRMWIHNLRSFLLKNYWITSKTMQVLRRRPTEQYGDHQHENEFNVQPQVIPDWLQDWLENRGGYLIGNIRTGRPDFGFYSLGNTLACLFGLLTAPQQRALFRLVLHNRSHLMAQMPMRICHPPMEAADWMNKTGSDPKNWPWRHHNGGHARRVRLVAAEPVATSAVGRVVRWSHRHLGRAAIAHLPDLDHRPSWASCCSTSCCGSIQPTCRCSRSTDRHKKTAVGNGG